MTDWDRCIDRHYCEYNDHHHHHHLCDKYRLVDVAAFGLIVVDAVLAAVDDCDYDDDYDYD